MNEYVLDILLYLFENFSLPEVGATGEIREDLGNAGFHPDEINDAFDWLRATQLEGQAAITSPSADTLRIYTDSEQRVLDAECRSYIIQLENAGVLSATSRELVIDRLMALVDDEFEAIEIEQVKWVTMMVLSSIDGAAAQARMEAMLHAETPGSSH